MYRALLSSAADRIPAARLTELRQTVCRYYGVEELDSAWLERSAAMDTRCVTVVITMFTLYGYNVEEQGEKLYIYTGRVGLD